MKRPGLSSSQVPKLCPNTPDNASTIGGSETSDTCFSTERVAFCTVALNDKPKKHISMQVAIDMHQPALLAAVYANPTSKPSTAASTVTPNAKAVGSCSLKTASLSGLGT